MQRWRFQSTNTTIVRIWSSWLVHKTDLAAPSPSGHAFKVYLDTPDSSFMEFLPNLDVLVISSGHWFSNRCIYVHNGTTAGNTTDSIEAYGMAMETSLNAIATHEGYAGLTIVRSYSPVHYEGGAWNKGGSCGGIVSPETRLGRNRYTDAMHEKQVIGLERATKRLSNGSKLRFMDVTMMSAYRHDGHPGPYRRPGSGKAVKQGEKPAEDCLHWCMPGLPDAWNEVLFEILRREL